MDLFNCTPHYGVFDTADGRRIALGIVHEQHFWQRFCDEFDLIEERDSTFAERQRDHRRLRQRLEKLFAVLPAPDILARTSRVDVPAAMVLNPEDLLESAPFQERGLIRSATNGARYAHPVRFGNGSAKPSSVVGSTPKE